MNSYSTNENFFEDYSIMIEDPVQFAEVYSFVQDFVVTQDSTPPLSLDEDESVLEHHILNP